MVEPALAAICPRVSGPDGERRPLDDVIELLLSRHVTGIVVLAGAKGIGKTTALSHVTALLAVRPEWQQHCVVMDTLESAIAASESEELRSQLIIAEAEDSSTTWNQRLTLSGWNRDDIIEYLVARFPTSCASVMSRVSDGSLCEGLPLLWTIAIHHLVADQTLPGVRSALMKHLREMHLTLNVRRALCRLAWSRIIGDRDTNDIQTSLLESIESAGDRQFMVAEPVQCLLACEYYATQLRSPRGQSVLQRRLPDDLLPYVADELQGDHEVLNQLANMMARQVDRALHAAAATLLVAVDPAWRPHSIMRESILREATLNRVSWPGLDLSGSDLSNASLNDADLSDAILAGVMLDSASLKRANLQRASLTDGVSLSNCDAAGAWFQQADLTAAVFDGGELDGANFDGALMNNVWLNHATLFGTSFRHAFLKGAVLNGAKLQDCDFSMANLESASLDGLDLTRCCFDNAWLEKASLENSLLEDVSWQSVVLVHANLRNAVLTGSQLHHADMRWANFTGARLGDIDWENADLRFANLTGVTFHMGSSRGGLIFSPFASEGSRTGFYTDDFGDQHFKAPEEIRKANLRGADLRGACLTGADLYLVDLRNAKLDPHQMELARSCRAILADWVVD